MTDSSNADQFAKHLADIIAAARAAGIFEEFHLTAMPLAEELTDPEAEQLLLVSIDQVLESIQRAIPEVSEGLKMRRVTVEGSTVVILSSRIARMPFITDAAGYAAFMAGLHAGLELLGRKWRKEDA